MMQIGTEKIDTNVFLSPLAGSSDLAFRLISRENGARFCFFEMVDSNSMVRVKRRSIDILRTSDMDQPIGAQLLGSQPQVMLEAANRILSVAGVKLLDINLACPVKKAIKKKSGAYLLTDPNLAGKIVTTLCRELDIPVTVKIRIGLDRAYHDDLIKLVKTCEDSGAKAIFVHGRTAKQGYYGDIDYRSIRLVKDSVSVPVIGVGNIMCALSAKRMLEETGCDAVAVARGAMGNPWIFSEIASYLGTGNLPEPVTMAVRKATLIRHLQYVDLYSNSSKAGKLGLMRKVSLWYVKEFDMARRGRQAIAGSKSYEALLSAIDSVYSNTRCRAWPICRGQKDA